MAELMGDPRDPDAHDDAPTAADDTPALVLETAPVDTSAVVGGDAAAAREAAAHFAKGQALYKRREWPEAREAFRAAVEADPMMSQAWLGISDVECHMNGGRPCEACREPLMRCIAFDPNNASAHIAQSAACPRSASSRSLPEVAVHERTCDGVFWRRA